MSRASFLFVLLAIPALPAFATGTAPSSAADGFVHGTATWPNGDQVTGFIRWEDEEAFWGDLFHTEYRENPWSEYLDLDRMKAERRKEYFATHGLIDRLAYALNEDNSDPIGWRMLLIRIGDIKRIEIRDGRDDFLTTADGSRHQIGTYGNDAGADLVIYSGEAVPVRVEWNDLESLDFFAAPPGAAPYGQRAHGVVETSVGNFEGFVQWDVTECVSVDVLDGRLEGENRDFLLGDVRSLERAPRQDATIVTTRDGEQVTLGGSNDLNSGNRGIYVENEAYGRVLIPWKRFQKVTFQDGKGSGPAHGTYDHGQPLQGSVVDSKGRRYQGRIIYDADEGWNWDILSGKAEGVEYHIPFHLISSITPLKDSRCRVGLKNGAEYTLGQNQDTGDGHAGVVILASGSDPVHLPWSEVAEILFQP
jgi:hypothetical protein